MTVVATLITQNFTAHATDSLLTRLSDSGDREAVEWELTKIVPVRAWRGAMAYWGLSLIEGRWSTLEWLRNQTQEAATCTSPEDFAKTIADRLNSELERLGLSRPLDGGIGIHFTAYERVHDLWIPELFLVTNFDDPLNTTLRSSGVGHSRETYKTFAQTRPEVRDGEPDRRLEVARQLSSGGWLHYNNGDPLLFNQAAASINGMLLETNRRGVLVGLNNQAVMRSLVRLPLEVVSTIQRDFFVSGRRVVGGRIHDLLITPAGEYSSSSGDAT